MKVLEKLLFNLGIFLSEWDCFFAEGMPRKFNPLFHRAPGFAFSEECPWLRDPGERTDVLAPPVRIPTSSPPPAQAPAVMVFSFYFQVGVNPPTEQRVLPGVGRQNSHRRPDSEHCQKTRAQDTDLVTVEKENLTLFRKSTKYRRRITRLL